MNYVEDGQPDEPAEIDLWPEPKPLPDVLPPVARFDAQLLPDAVRPFIEDVAERMQCPIDFPAVAMMIVLAGALGRKIAIRPKRRDDWTVIANLWGVAVGRPGLMKTPAIMEPLKFLKRLEIEAKKRFEEQNAEYLAGALVAKASMQVAEAAIKKALKDGADPNEIARTALAQETEQPARRRYLLTDPTVEKLGEILNQNPNGVTLARDELYAFLKSLDKEGHEGARGFYLQPDDDDVPYLRFDPDAQGMFNEWHKQLENRLRGDELPPALESHLAKYRSLIPSLALLIHLADDGVAEIPATALDKAIQWGQYLESHACRLYASAVHSDITAARCLAKKIRDGSLADGFTVKDVYRPGWSGLTTSEEAQAAIELLVDLDWLEVAAMPTGGRKRTEHRINPRLRQKHPGKELPELPKDPFGSFGSTPEEGSQDSAIQF